METEKYLAFGGLLASQYCDLFRFNVDIFTDFKVISDANASLDHIAPLFEFPMLRLKPRFRLVYLHVRCVSYLWRSVRNL